MAVCIEQRSSESDLELKGKKRSSPFQTFSFPTANLLPREGWINQETYLKGPLCVFSFLPRTEAWDSRNTPGSPVQTHGHSLLFPLCSVCSCVFSWCSNHMYKVLAWLLQLFIVPSPVSLTLSSCWVSCYMLAETPVVSVLLAPPLFLSKVLWCAQGLGSCGFPPHAFWCLKF